MIPRYAYVFLVFVVLIIAWLVNYRVARAHVQFASASLDRSIHRGMDMKQVTIAVKAVGEEPVTVSNSVTGNKTFVWLKWPGIPFTNVHFITYIFDESGHLVSTVSTDYSDGL